MYNINYFKNYGSEDHPYWQSVNKEQAKYSTELSKEMWAVS